MIEPLNVHPAVYVGRCSCCHRDYRACRCEDWERGRDAARSGIPARIHDLNRTRRTGA